MSHTSTADMIYHAGPDTALAWHLAHNHYPPVPATMLPVCVAAVELATAEQWDEMLALPDGVTYRGSGEAPVSAVVEQHHLQPFVEAALESLGGLVIRSVADGDEDLYWSNEDGWGDLASATVFTTNESHTVRLPDEGVWVPL